MKIRNGFVSNSSSSSFICDVSGGVESGMDASLSDFDMSQCINGHTFYDHYRVGDPDADNENLTDEEREEKEDEWGSDWNRYEMSEKYCPICTMKNFKDEELLAFIYKETNTQKQWETIIRDRFPTYKKFKAYLNKKD